DTSLDECFEAYKKAAEITSKQKGFYIDGYLQEILCLLNVLFLKESEYSDQQVKHFGLEYLKQMHAALVREIIDPKVKFDTKLYNDISAIFRVSLGEIPP
ncbi:hypothetical protein BDB00DRAFT_757539, partial [Zychaea mexicana]|uniref:uncharacterized protein n=1 Tax=Zychaea mexicana TaxID=64656 RepID=UPI0022FE2A9F